MNTDIFLESLAVPELETTRQTGYQAHEFLRRWILEGAIPPGTVLKQSDLARRFGTSRTPIREAFRMLQEEGLIDADPNKRAVVRGLDGEELDQLYGARIVLESLAARITAGKLQTSEVEDAWACLDAMTDELLASDPSEWARLHRRFHALCVARAGDPMLKVITSYAERSERYVRLYQTMHPERSNARVQHEGILHAIQDGDSVLGSTRLAQHLASTAFTVLNDLPLGDTGQATRAAVEMATGKKARGSL